MVEIGLKYSRNFFHTFFERLSVCALGIKFVEIPENVHFSMFFLTIIQCHKIIFSFLS